jgi:hypothetical protein
LSVNPNPSSNNASLSEKDLDTLVRITYAEAGREPEIGKVAVLHVIKTRMAKGNFGGKAVSDVVYYPNAFEPVKSAVGKANMAKLNPSDAEYQRIADLAKGVFNGSIPDPTGGADHFANVATVRERNSGGVTDWMRAKWDTKFDIARHSFFGGDRAEAERVTASLADKYGKVPIIQAISNKIYDWEVFQKRDGSMNGWTMTALGGIVASLGLSFFNRDDTREEKGFLASLGSGIASLAILGGVAGFFISKFTSKDEPRHDGNMAKANIPTDGTALASANKDKQNTDLAALNLPKNKDRLPSKNIDGHPTVNVAAAPAQKNAGGGGFGVAPAG